MEINQKYKNAALAALDGNWAPSVVASVVMYALLYLALGASLAPSFIPMANNMVLGCLGFTYAGLFFIYMPLSVGVSYTFNRLYAEGDNNVTGNLFRDSLDGYFRNVWGMFLMFIFVFLWSLLFLIPGIIKAYSYAMTPYILKDYPELSANQAINLSRKMMKGHKLDLFILQLSFIGWGILTLFTAGIGTLWLMPYMMTAQAAFYQDIKNDHIINY